MIERILIELELADDSYDPPRSWDWRNLLDLVPDDTIHVSILSEPIEI